LKLQQNLPQNQNPATQRKIVQAQKFLGCRNSKGGAENRDEKMNWYLASLQMRNTYAVAAVQLARRCQYLIAANDNEAAHRKSLQIGNESATKTWNFGGLEDLLLVDDSPNHRSELSWSQLELSPQALEREVRKKHELRAFSLNQSDESGWYVASIVLCEIHDQGSHGNQLLIWINSYLIAANSAETAYIVTNEIGREHQDSPGSHLCDGEKAHWEFKGIKELIPLQQPPSDGSLLWCEEFSATIEKLQNMLPEKSDLSLFKWLTEQNADRRGITQ
jgi:hypothetical protein